MSEARFTFSAVIPAFNTAAFLPAALESAERQTFQDFEVLVVDDGSTDSTWEAIESWRTRFAGRFKSIRLTPQERKGPAGARNLAIKHACGEFIAFLDSDDLWAAEHLARAEQSLHGHDRSVGLYCGPGQILGSSHVIEVEEWPPPAPQSTTARLLKGGYFPLPSVCVRRDLLELIGGFNETLLCYEDWLLYLQLSKRTRFVHSPFIECLVRLREGSTTSTGTRMSKAMYRDAVRVYLVANALGFLTGEGAEIMRGRIIG